MVKNLAERHDQHRDVDHWLVTAVMSAPTVAVRHTATMEEALQALAVSGLRQLAVIDGLGVCAGLLTDRTVATRVAMTLAASTATATAAAISTSFHSSGSFPGR
jgi:CBS-domain-containing membrane protein